MKKLYTVLSTLCLAATALTAGAQTTADIAGTYSLSTELSFTGFEAEPVLPTNYDVTITASETSADSLWMDGFLGSALDDTSFGSAPIPGVYDAATKTITFTMPSSSVIVEPSTYSQFMLNEPLTLSVSQDEETGLVTLSTTDDVILTAAIGMEQGSAMLSTFAMTQKQTYTIALENLPGEYKLEGTFQPSDGTDAYEGSLNFTLALENDSLFLTKFAGYELRQAVTYNGTSITIPAGMAVNEEGTAYLYSLMSQTYGDVTFEFGEDNTLELSAAGMIAVTEEIGAIVYISDATASNTTYAGYEIDEEYLIGTWELGYTLTPSDGSDAYETTTKFIITKEDGQLYLNGIFGSDAKLAITTDGKSITVPATMEINDSQTAYLLLFCSMKMSDVVLPFGEDNTILIPSDGVCGASESIGMMFYIFDGTAKKTSDSTEGISAITAAPAANAAIYTLDGRKVKSAEGKGVFIVNGKKVIK